jgi:choice-of-anchor B domain-containing protein
VSSQDYFNVELLDKWTDTTLIKGPENVFFSDVWGFKFKGEKYCALGSTEGTHIFSIKNNRLTLVDFEPGKYQSLLVQHRDFKTYKNYLYGVCDEGGSSLQIFDLSYLPDSIHKVYDSDSYFQICHNIFIDTNKAKLYACGPNNLGMKVFDISNPIQPVLWYDFNQVNYVHDCYVTNDTAFLNCGFDGLQIYNFSTQQIQQLGLLDFYVEQGYNHSGWLSEDRKKYVFVDENMGKRIKICDATSLIDINVSYLYGTSDYANNVAHNVMIYDDFLFISYYNEGLRIVDISGNTSDEVAYYDTFWQDTNYKLNGAWGVFVFKDENLILISDRQNGLFLFYFPISLSRLSSNNTLVTNTPFVNENSVIIYPNPNNNDLFFTIYNSAGQIVYSHQSLFNWMSLPLNLDAGQYYFKILSKDNFILDTGKFIIVN